MIEAKEPELQGISNPRQRLACRWCGRTAFTAPDFEGDRTCYSCGRSTAETWTPSIDITATDIIYEPRKPRGIEYLLVYSGELPSYRDKLLTASLLRGPRGKGNRWRFNCPYCREGVISPFMPSASPHYDHHWSVSCSSGHSFSIGISDDQCPERWWFPFDSRSVRSQKPRS